MINRMILMIILGYIAPVFAAPQIYHGKNVTSDQQFPFVVAIYDREGNQSHCTGSVISDTWVLTASHCVFKSDDDGNRTSFISPEDIFVGTGYLARNKSSATKIISVKKIYTYSDETDPTLLHDIALLKLSEPADVMPVDLPESADSFPKLKAGSQSTTAIGYGWIDIKWSPDCDKYPDDPQKCHIEDVVWDKFLHYGDELVQTDKAVEDLINKYSDLDPSPSSNEPKVTYNFTTMLGAVSPDGTRTTHGDSGGPLLLSINQENGNNKYVQVGVVSWGILPISYVAYKKGYWDNAPDVYAKLTDRNTLDYIRMTIKNNS